MKIAAITKFKHGSLWEALRKAGWSQSELARRVGVTAGTIGIICNMRVRPSQALSDKIQEAFAAVGIYFDVLEAWPKEFRGLGKTPIIEQVKEIDLSEIGYREYLQLTANSSDTSDALIPLVEEAVDKLKPLDKSCLYEWLNGESTYTIAKKIGVGPPRVAQRISHAKRAIRLYVEKKKNDCENDGPPSADLIKRAAAASRNRFLRNSFLETHHRLIQKLH